MASFMIYFDLCEDIFFVIAQFHLFLYNVHEVDHMINANISSHIMQIWYKNSKLFV